MISGVLSALTLLFTRLDRRSDKVMSATAIRDGLLQLEGLLTRWTEAAERTKGALDTGDEALADLARNRACGPAPSSTVGTVLTSNIGAGLAVDRWFSSDDDERTGRLRQLVDVYAPETAEALRAVAANRLGLLEQALAVEGLEQPGGHRALWADRLNTSLEDLRNARAQLRLFIAANSPSAAVATDVMILQSHQPPNADDGR